VGYRNLSNFNRQFRSNYAMTPSNYLRRRQPVITPPPDA